MPIFSSPQRSCATSANKSSTLGFPVYTMNHSTRFSLSKSAFDHIKAAFACNLMSHISITITLFNTMRLRQNGSHFADDLFKYIFLNENVWIWNKILLKFVSKGSINNIPALVQIRAWHRPGDKPLSEQMVVRLLMYIYASWPQWFNY